MRLISQAGAVLMVFATITAANAWQMKQAALMSDWAQQVDANNPLPEYPRPQLVRSNWLNLNGVWQFQAGNASDAVPVNQTLSEEILVPYPMESALSGVKAYHVRSWYRRTFTVPVGWSGQQILLHLDAVDWESEVFINGHSVGVHKGGYDAATYDVTAYLSGNGSQELIVRVYDPTDAAGEPRGKQTLYPGGIMYASCSGIWQPVWLEPVPATCIASLKLAPDIDLGRLNLAVNVSGPTNGITVSAVARIGANVVASISGAPNAGLILTVPNPTLWSPANPFLYDLTVALQKNGADVDKVESYFGMRKISLGTTNGFVKMLLNNQFVFQFGPLDQGFWPDGIYTAPTDNALRSDLEMAKAAGFNMIRKHIKVERPRWYYWADKLGILVWQDMPSINSYTSNPQPIDAPQFEAELVRMVQNHWNSPSIIMWVLFNEAQGQHDTAALVQEVKTLDPSRLVNQASGGDYAGVGDILDTHSYPPPNYGVSATQAVVCGEFGGVGLGITNHTWAPGWGYIGAADGDDLTAKFEGFSSQLCDFVQNHGLSAAVYTELTDVETELNGFYTYDRKVCKPNLSRARVAMLAPLGQYGFSAIVPSSQTTGQVWKYTTNAPAANWYATNFVDTAWINGLGGFGAPGTPNAVVRTTWTTSDIWLRRAFNPGALTAQQLSNLVFNVHHDEDVEIYLNGILVYLASGYTGSYSHFPMNKVARDALLINANNNLAVHCHQTLGGQYIDVGIDLRTIIVAPPEAAAAPAWLENGTGLHGEYFSGTNLSSLALERTDAVVDFNWGTGFPAPGIAADQFSIRWTGQIQPRYSEVYTFHLTADDGCRLWVNGALLIDKWRNDSGTDVAGSLSLVGGQKYDIRAEYYENTVDASVKLEWNSASQLREIVPTGVLFASGAVVELPSATNLAATAMVTNRAPLLATPFSALPLGSVRPRGWLLTQCQLQRDGLTGNAEAIYSGDLGVNSGWLGGSGESWERGPYYFKGLVSLAYVLNDSSLKQKAQKWMNWLLDHPGGDGSIGPVSNNDWWPRMVATYALRDYYEATADVRVPTVLSNYFHYMLASLPARPLNTWGKARAGDQIETVLWLYNRNGDTNLLLLVNLLRKQAFDWPGIFTSNSFMLFGTDFHAKHNVNVEQALKFPALCYEVSQQPVDRDAVSLGLQHLAREHGLSCGINSGTEFLSGNASAQGVELCSTVEAMLSLETAARITGDPALVDRLEMISFNALPAGLANSIKGIQYYTLPNNVIAVNGSHGYNQDYSNGTLPGPNSGYACCCYNFHMGWPKFVQNSWAATSDDGLALIAYGPTVVNSMVAGQQVQITEDTSYPFEEQVRLRIALSKVVAFPLVLRVPGWCSNAIVRVNGQIQCGVAAGSFFRVKRAWTNGDLVSVDLPMPLQTQTGPSQSVAINRGPLVYSLRIGENWTVRTPDPLGQGFDEFEVRPTTPWAYGLQLSANLDASLTFSKFTTPSNPFDPAQPSVSLLASAKRISGWTNGWRGTHAFEPPTSPVACANSLEAVTLVPFGSQHMRVSWFPYLGIATRSTSFREAFDSSWSQRWTVFGGNWSARDGVLSTMPASANGAKALAMQTAFTNLTYEGDVLVGPVGNAGLLFRASKPDIGADSYCGYYVGINAQNAQLELGWASNSWHSITNLPMAIAPNTFYHLKIQMLGSRLRLFVSDTNQPVLDLQDGTFAGGMIGVRNYCPDGNQSLSSFSNLVAKEFVVASAEVPRAWYPFEGNIGDASGNGNDGTISGNVPFSTGKLGAQAAQFSGDSSDYVTIPRSVSNSFTIAFWLKTTATGGSGGWFNGKGFVDGEMANIQDDFGTALVGNKAAFGVGNPDTTIATTSAVNDGLWHHVAATRDSVSGQMNLYLDGSLQATTTGPVGTKAAPPNLRIGSMRTGTPAGFLTGSIDDVQIFDRVFSVAEIPSLMNHAPSLMPVFDASTTAGRTFHMTNFASDPDQPAQTLSFSLQNPPSGAAINPFTGTVTWRPNVSQSGANYPFVICVTDNGTPNMIATQSFSVLVARPLAPSLGFSSYTGGGFQMAVGGDSGPDYKVYYSTNLALQNWSWLQTTTQAVVPFLFTDAGATNSAQRFYRVSLGP